ncbi:alkaline phosphatase family protein [Rhodococcus pyridinivorans]|uniref:phage holin family protein n=1 Tax=Rhodococcus TaxID=1827 RepID=UPI0009035B05|nr:MULTISPECIES: phage holin family protein [Rhodococcus]APE07981.1 nucleotide pyrophosphatase [Rhodococcus sp. 2G]UVT26727.1 alkaline phosphatase family protein [Rhodococcus pyridinivorans]
MRTMGSLLRILVEFLVLWGSSTLVLVVLDRILGGITLDRSGFAPIPTLPAALVLALVFGLLNAALWPVMMRLMSWVGPVLLFAGVFLAGGAIMLLTLYLVPVATVDRPLDAIVLAAPVSLVTSVVSSAIASRSDTAYRLMQVRRNRFRLRRKATLVDATPGLLCIQIDGLGYDVLRRAIADGVTPGLAKLVRETHRLVPWYTDWSSQTGATQLGVLHGSNHNVPAFRWYDKTTGRISVFSNPADNEQRELERADRPGLLAHDGASRGNLFTGGAQDNVLVVSRMRGARLGGGAGYSAYFADPASALRTFIRMIAELQRELRQSLRQKRKDIRPRVPRGGIYPFVRAFATVLATDVTAAAVVGDLIEGRTVVYLDLIGYDEVSHHSGISRPETLAVLTKVDDIIEMLLAVAEQSDRSYRVVVLSDHGQSQGATFLQRYGESLRELVVRLTTRSGSVAPDGHRHQRGGEEAAQPGAEGRAYAAASMHVAADEQSRPAAGEPIVLGSGNLGLIYFPHLPGRADIDAIEAAHPGLLAGLREHPGIGFLLVAAPGGSVVLGPHGRVDVTTGEVTGRNPLEVMGLDALSKIRRTDTFGNVADIMVGGAYWPETDEVAAFEEQIGSHGGMGGPQSTPFLLYPATLPPPPEPLKGAENIHEVLVGWRDLSSRPSTAATGHDATTRSGDAARME